MLHTTAGRRTAGLSLAGVTALVAATLAPSPVFAVPPGAPLNLSVQQPNDSTSVLTWDHVAGATRYQVQVDDDPGFGSLDVSITTVNNTYVPTANLPSGNKYWRVLARNAASESSEWSISSFGNAGVSVPQPASPPDGTTLAQPSQPPLLTWSTSPGATSYKVEVDGDDDFVGSTSYSTASTSFVWPDPLPAGTNANPADYYWRVTALKGSALQSQPSPASRFIVGPLAAPTITAPPSSPNFELQDVVMDWTPVPGAKSYDVEVATNSDFTTITESRTGITGTRYSPTVSYDNDQYFWRVRARDLDDQPTPWTASLYDFNRTWPHQPQALFPAEPGNETVVNPIYFEWTSVPHASEYEIQVSHTPGFSDGTYHSCRTAGTTYTPGMFAVNTSGIPAAARVNEDCEPYPGTINYWKVRPLDSPFTKLGGGDIPGIQGIFSEVQAFLYNPIQISGMSPTGGETVQVPTLTWNPSTGAEYYNVEIFDNANNSVAKVKTYATSFTPDGTKQLPTSGNPYSWTLSATSSDRIQSVIHRRSFNVSGTNPPPPASSTDYLRPISGITTDAPFATAPSLRWQPHPNAASYVVNVGHAMDAGQIWFGHANDDLFGQPVPYNAMTDTGDRLLLPGTYDWQVTALNADGQAIDIGPEGRFTVAEVAESSEHALAIGGRELDRNNPATKTPCNPLSGPCVVPATPVLKWKAQDYASFYMVYVSRDASFTNLLESANAIPATTNSMFAPALDNRFWTYPDTEAGEALYWYIRPCRKVNNCSGSPVSTIGKAQHSFSKTSPRVDGLVSSDPSKTEITFSWNNYFDTNRASVWAQTGELRPQSAKQYRIQVDDTESFDAGNGLVDERIVDQATYTAFTELYPEGQLFWRVQAIDSKGDTAGNGRLSWSQTQTFTKSSPRVQLTAPVNGASVPGTVALRWAPQPFAAEYKVELYRNNDSTFPVSGANRVFSKTVRTTAYAHTVPLPVSPQPYVWRVQRIDTAGNPGPWSWGGSPDTGGNAVGRFTVDTGLLEITSPAPGGVQPPNGPVLTWRDFPGAVKYNVEVTSPSGGFATTGQTVATAFAPTGNFASGTYPWKVTALDSSNNSLGSAQSSFVVDARLVATAPPQVHAPAGTGIGATLTSTPPSWNQADVAMTYQWLRDGANISGATGTSYVLTVADYNRAISLRVTGRRSGFSDGVTVSTAIGATAGGALQATAGPTITGTAASGETLRATPGTWSQPSPTIRYQWLRTGAPIPGATSSSYRLTPEDAGKNVSVTVLASKAGYSDGSAATPAVLVAKLVSKTVATLSASRIKVGARAKMGITVTVPGVTGPAGVIKVMDGTKTIKSLTMFASHKGKITLKLPKLKKGKHRIRAKYLGDASTVASQSAGLRLSVLP